MLVMHLIRSQDHLQRKRSAMDHSPLSSTDSGMRKESGILRVKISVWNPARFSFPNTWDPDQHVGLCPQQVLETACAWLPRTKTTDRNGACGKVQKMQNVQARTCFFICHYHLIPLVWFRTLNKTTCCLHWSAIAWQIILEGIKGIPASILGPEVEALQSLELKEIMHRIHPVFHLIGNPNKLGPTKVVDPQSENQHWVLSTC